MVPGVTEAKVGDLHLAIPVQQDVLQFEVAVHDAIL